MQKTGFWDIVLVVFILVATMMTAARCVFPLVEDDVMGYTSSYLDKSVTSAGEVTTVLNTIEGTDYVGVDSVFELDYAVLHHGELDISAFHRVYSTPELALLFSVQDAATGTTEVTNTLFLQTVRLAGNQVLTSRNAPVSSVRALLNSNALSTVVLDPWLRATQTYGYSRIDWETLTVSSIPNYSRIDLNSDLVANRFDLVATMMNLKYEDPSLAERRFYITYQHDISDATRAAIAGSIPVSDWRWFNDMGINDGMWVFLDVGSNSALNYFRMMRHVAECRLAA